MHRQASGIQMEKDIHPKKRAYPFQGWGSGAYEYEAMRKIVNKQAKTFAILQVLLSLERDTRGYSCFAMNIPIRNEGVRATVQVNVMDSKEKIEPSIMCAMVTPRKHIHIIKRRSLLPALEMSL